MAIELKELRAIGGGSAIPVTGTVTTDLSDQLTRDVGKVVPVTAGDSPLYDETLDTVKTSINAITNTITVAGGANAIATATLPAAGVGLFHYITHIHISRVATAALAGGAILTVTTTNLNGRTWRTGNQASITVATQFNQPFIEADYVHPLRSQVSNTATTIVGPAAGAAVSWHIVVDYYIGP